MSTSGLQCKIDASLKQKISLASKDKEDFAQD